MIGRAVVLVSIAWATAAGAAAPAPAPAIHIPDGGPGISFDFPNLKIGVAQYEDGPTGTTVFYFPNRALVAVDVRGGAPGTVNTDILRLGYSDRFIDAIVFAGGSLYGEEATTAVMTALMDDGSHNGDWNNIAMSAGAIIYDFVDHRLNDIYPDKRLA